MLQCHAKNCNTYPLSLQDVELESVESDFNPEFIKKIISRLDWSAFVETALALGMESLPRELPLEFSPEFLQNVHNVALNHQIKQGNMLCTGCGHIYPIIDGIPNMLLQNSEI
jgi:multifunctional methyltransferase subunit TRM112